MQPWKVSLGLTVAVLALFALVATARFEYLHPFRSTILTDYWWPILLYGGSAVLVIVIALAGLLRTLGLYDLGRRSATPEPVRRSIANVPPSWPRIRRTNATSATTPALTATTQPACTNTLPPDFNSTARTTPAAPMPKPTSPGPRYRLIRAGSPAARRWIPFTTCPSQPRPLPAAAHSTPPRRNSTRPASATTSSPADNSTTTFPDPSMRYRRPDSMRWRSLAPPQSTDLHPNSPEFVAPQASESLPTRTRARPEAHSASVLPGSGPIRLPGRRMTLPRAAIRPPGAGRMTLVRIRTTPRRLAWLAPLALLVAHVTLAQGRHTTAHVTRVIDGDTIAVTLANGEPATVRLLGIDTPELARAGRAAEPFAEAAARAARRGLWAAP